MPDLLKRLRDAGNDYTIAWGSGDLYDEAADEIETLQAEVARLTRGQKMLGECIHNMVVAQQSVPAHTPGPWFALPHAYRDEGPGSFSIADSEDPNKANILCSRFQWPERANEMHANARLIAAAPELLEALQWQEQFKARDGENGTSFERVAENFHRATGYVAPGKDCRVHSPEERQAAWDAWIAAGTARTRAAIAKATGGAA